MTMTTMLPQLTSARRILLSLVCLFSCVRNVFSSKCNTVSSVGRDFYIGLPYINETDVIYAYSINILAGENGTAFIQAPAFHINRTYSIREGHNTIRLENQNTDPTVLTMYAAGLHLLSDMDITVSVFVYGRKYRIADTYLVLPSNTLSKEYVISSSRPIREYLKNQIIVIGTKPDTFVTLQTGETRKIGRLEALVIELEVDGSGMQILASEPVAVISASKSASPPAYTSHYGAEPNIEMVLPTEFGGKFYIVPPLPNRSHYLVKVFALYNDTNLHVFNKSLSTRTKVKQSKFQEFSEYVLGDDYLNIKADKPVQVYQYAFSTGNTQPDYTGTFLRSISAYEHYVTFAVFVVQTYDRDIKNYLQVITDNPDLVFIDGISINNYTSNNIGTIITDQRLSDFVFYSTSIFSVSMDDPPFNNIPIHKIYSAGNAKFSALMAGYASHQQSAYGQQVGIQSIVCTNSSETVATAQTTSPSIPTSTTVVTKPTTTTTTNALTTKTTTGKLPTANVTSGKGPLCLQCDDLTHLYLCNTFVRCSRSQVCFVDKYINTAEQARFNMGCRENKLCKTNEDQAIDGLMRKRRTTCTQCCHGNFCNNKGCGAEDFPVGVQHGPVCLTCHHVLSVDECNTVSYCQQDEVCSIRVSEWFPGLNQLKLECANKQCIGTRSVSRRSSILCEHCCSGDFCNQECRVPVPAVIG